jgi:VanZ family protein
MPRLFKQQSFWLAGFLTWFSVLWWLSSTVHPDLAQIDIPNWDKIAHFGYYFGGGGIFAAYLFARHPKNPPWRTIIVSVIVGIALVGILDEFHQSHVPGRSGNDPWDWLADISGATAGVLTFKAIHRRLKWDS